MKDTIKEFITVFENQNKGYKVGAMYDMGKWWLVSAYETNKKFETDYETPFYAIDKETKQASTFTPTEHLDMYIKALQKEVYSE